MKYTRYEWPSDSYLAELGAKLTTQEIAIKIGIPYMRVVSRFKRHGITVQKAVSGRKRSTNSIIGILRDTVPGKSSEIVYSGKCTINDLLSIYQRRLGTKFTCVALGGGKYKVTRCIERSRYSRHAWPAVEQLRDMAAKFTVRELALQLGIPYKTVGNRLSRLGIKGITGEKPGRPRIKGSLLSTIRDLQAGKSTTVVYKKRKYITSVLARYSKYLGKKFTYAKVSDGVFTITCEGELNSGSSTVLTSVSTEHKDMLVSIHNACEELRKHSEATEQPDALPGVMLGTPVPEVAVNNSADALKKEAAEIVQVFKDSPIGCDAQPGFWSKVGQKIKNLFN